MIVSVNLSAMRKKYGVTMLAVRQNGDTLSNPDVDIEFLPDDILFILGRPEQFTRVTNIFHNEE